MESVTRSLQHSMEAEMGENWAQSDAIEEKEQTLSLLWLVTALSTLQGAHCDRLASSLSSLHLFLLTSQNPEPNTLALLLIPSSSLVHTRSTFQSPAL